MSNALKKTKAAKAFHIESLSNPYIGKRSGLNLLEGKVIRKAENGIPVFDDYFTDNDNTNQTASIDMVDTISEEANHQNKDLELNNPHLQKNSKDNQTNKCNTDQQDAIINDEILPPNEMEYQPYHDLSDSVGAFETVCDDSSNSSVKSNGVVVLVNKNQAIKKPQIVPQIPQLASKIPQLINEFPMTLKPVEIETMEPDLCPGKCLSPKLNQVFSEMPILEERKLACTNNKNAIKEATNEEIASEIITNDIPLLTKYNQEVSLTELDAIEENKGNKDNRMIVNNEGLVKNKKKDLKEHIEQPIAEATNVSPGAKSDSENKTPSSDLKNNNQKITNNNKKKLEVHEHPKKIVDKISGGNDADQAAIDKNIKKPVQSKKFIKRGSHFKKKLPVFKETKNKQSGFKSVNIEIEDVNEEVKKKSKTQNHSENSSAIVMDDNHNMPRLMLHKSPGILKPTSVELIKEIIESLIDSIDQPLEIANDDANEPEIVKKSNQPKENFITKKKKTDEPDIIEVPVEENHKKTSSKTSKRKKKEPGEICIATHSKKATHLENVLEIVEKSAPIKATTTKTISSTAVKKSKTKLVDTNAQVNELEIVIELNCKALSVSEDKETVESKGSQSPKELEIITSKKAKQFEVEPSGRNKNVNKTKKKFQDEVIELDNEIPAPISTEEANEQVMQKDSIADSLLEKPEENNNLVMKEAAHSHENVTTAVNHRNSRVVKRSTKKKEISPTVTSQSNEPRRSQRQGVSNNKYCKPEKNIPKKLPNKTTISKPQAKENTKIQSKAKNKHQKIIVDSTPNNSQIFAGEELAIPSTSGWVPPHAKRRKLERVSREEECDSDSSDFMINAQLPVQPNSRRSCVKIGQRSNGKKRSAPRRSWLTPKRKKHFKKLRIDSNTAKNLIITTEKAESQQEVTPVHNVDSFKNHPKISSSFREQWKSDLFQPVLEVQKLKQVEIKKYTDADLKQSVTPDKTSTKTVNNAKRKSVIFQQDTILSDDSKLQIKQTAKKNPKRLKKAIKIEENLSNLESLQQDEPVSIMSKIKINLIPIDSRTPGTPGLRRSKRIKVPTLAHWRNERVVYTCNKSGNFEAVGINPGHFNELGVNIERNAKRNVNKKTNPIKKKVSSPHSLSIHNKSRLRKFKEENMENSTHPDGSSVLACKFSTLSWVGPKTKVAPMKQPYIMAKVFNNSNTSLGYLTIRPSKMKQFQMNLTHTLYFTVKFGKILVQVDEDSILLETDDSFVVKKGSAYQIENLRNDAAHLMFFSVKEENS